MSGKRVLIATGGSGGHLFPAQQLGALLKEKAEVAFAGHLLEKSPFFQREKCHFMEITAAALGKGFLRASWRGFWESIRWMRSFQPDVVVGFGSFHSFPVLLAAVILRKKLILFEANCAIGRVNRLFLPFAERIAMQFSLAACRRKGTLVSLLPWGEAKETVDRKEALEYFGLAQGRLTMLVFGGSQGAAFLNEVMPQVHERLKQKGLDLQMIHLTGRGSVHYAGDACVKSFEERMAWAYAAADLAVCRAGAGTMAELIHFQVPALLIPYPHATGGHQQQNGKFLSLEVNGARLLLQKEATVEKIAQEVDTLMQHREALQKALREYSTHSNKRMGLEELIHA